VAFLKNQSSTTSPEDSWGDLKKDDEGRPSDSLILPMVRGLRVLVIGDTPGDGRSWWRNCGNTG